MSDKVSHPYKTTGNIRVLYILIFIFSDSKLEDRRSQWQRVLRRRSAAARLLRLWVRMPPRACMSICCECCVVRERSLRRADHSSGGVLPTVVRRVRSRNLDNAEVLAPLGAVAPPPPQKKKTGTQKILHRMNIYHF